MALTELFSYIVIFLTLPLMTQCDRGNPHVVPVTPNVSFRVHIKPITSSVCISCHNSSGRDWSKYDDAFIHRLAIKMRVYTDRSMPMGQFMSEEDRALFRDWVDQGARP